jgi:hypothetical protein
VDILVKVGLVKLLTKDTTWERSYAPEGLTSSPQSKLPFTTGSVGLIYTPELGPEILKAKFSISCRAFILDKDDHYAST